MKSQSKFQAWKQKRRFNTVARCDFYAAMASFLDAGIAPYPAIERLLDVARRRRGQRHLVAIYADMIRRLTNGQSVGSTLAAWVPATEAAMLVAGDAGSSLPTALRELAGMLTIQKRLQATIRQSIISSGVLILALLGNVYFILSTVVPQSQALLPPSVADTMVWAPIYFAVGGAFLHLGPWLALTVVLLCSVAMYSLPRWTASARRHFDKWCLPWSLYRRIQAAFFLSSLAAMIRSGMPMSTILEDLRRHASKWQRWHYNRMLRNLGAGANEAEALNTGMLPDETLDQLYIYALLPSFGTVMNALAVSAMEAFEKRINRLSASLKVVVMIFVALFIVGTIFALGEVSLTISDAVSKQGSAIK